jgi:hypothetical protein
LRNDARHVPPAHRHIALDAAGEPHVVVGVNVDLKERRPWGFVV